MSGNRTFDVDIDVKSDTDKEKYGIRAMVYNAVTEKILPHPSGFYLEEVPVDALSNLASIDYKYGDEIGLMKVDLLTNTSYDIFHSKEEILNALETKPDWSLLKDQEFVDSLPHISGHYDIVKRIKPESVEELADVLALIRPAKIHLIESYIKNKKSARMNLYRRSSSDKAYFKKAHAISYALMIVCIMNARKNGLAFVW